MTKSKALLPFGEAVWAKSETRCITQITVSLIYTLHTHSNIAAVFTIQLPAFH